MILYEFVAWLQEKQPDLNQSDVARRAKLSQSAVNKLMRQRGTQPALETYRQIVRAFSLEWQQFLREHPRHAERLHQDFDWAMSVPRVVGSSPKSVSDPDFLEAEQIVRQVFVSSNRDQRQRITVLQVLRAISGRQAPAASERPKKRLRVVAGQDETVSDRPKKRPGKRR